MTSYKSIGVENGDVPETRRKNCCSFSFLVGGIGVAAVVGIVVVVVAVPLYGKKGSTTMCLSAECIKLSSSVRAALDQTVDPCTDFYNFSCGNWIKNTAIPSGEFRYLYSCTFMVRACINLSEQDRSLVARFSKLRI